MNYIQEQFEKRTGLSITLKAELTIFRKGVEAGRAFEKSRIKELEAENKKLVSTLEKLNAVALEVKIVNEKLREENNYINERLSSYQSGGNITIKPLDTQKVFRYY